MGSGAYGDVFIGTDLSSDHEDSWINFTTLAHENTVYQDIASGLEIPAVVWFGACGNYVVLIMDLLGQSLESLQQVEKHANDSDNPFLCVDKIASLAVQMIDLVHYIHSKGCIHCDIKRRASPFGLEPKKQHNVMI